MALSHDHPAYLKKLEQAKQAKRDILNRIYDVDQFSNRASHQVGCYACEFWSECTANLWMRELTADGIKYAPLRCFVEHPDYQAEMWRARS